MEGGTLTTPIASPPRVFISYAREDAAVAARLYNDLTLAGARPWIDIVDLLPGQHFGKVILDTIRTCDYFLALLSSNSVTKRGYVQRELQHALKALEEFPAAAVFIIPARLDDCKPMHEELSQLHWVDLFPSYEQGLKKIFRIVQPPNSVLPGMASAATILDPSELSDAGWGAIFPENSDPAIREALSPLLGHRRERAGIRIPELYKECSGYLGYQRGDSIYNFLSRYGAGPGPVDPTRIPRYLLLVGGPEEIPFSFQQQLGIQYFVGRICFDRLESYSRYAESVVRDEIKPSRTIRRLTLFAPQHEDDPPTDLITKQLLRPLKEGLEAVGNGWNVDHISGASASKARLLDALNANERATLLFAAGHGVGFTLDHFRQGSDQGAFLCSEFPGWKNWDRRVDPECYVAAADIQDDWDLTGLVVFCFSAFSAGVQEFDERTNPPERRASRSFVSQLAKKLLSNPGGAALALIGSIDTNRQSSIFWPSAGPVIQTFEYALSTLLKGKPAGMALEYFSRRHAELAASLQFLLKSDGAPSRDEQISLVWNSMLDSRNFILIGDPAVRIR
jgi:hypothetical protein